MSFEKPGGTTGTAHSHSAHAKHKLEIQRHMRAWDRKPALREIYHGFYRLIAARIASGVPGPVVEIGSGMGRIKSIIPGCTTTDLSNYRWLDRQENAYALTFEPGSISHLILFDVWHHLRYPGAALAEFHRVLAPGGRVILFEPAISWIGRAVYGLFHHEPVALRDPIAWDTPPAFEPWDADYYAAQGNASRLFWWGGAGARLAGWRIREATPLVSLSYLVTGGFSGPQILSGRLVSMMRAVDRAAAFAPRICATRLLVVLEKIPAAGAPPGK